MTVVPSLVKAVADVEHGLMALGGELHSDEEAVLLDQGSQQRHLWGINLWNRSGQTAAGAGAIDGRPVEKRRDPSEMGRQSSRAYHRASGAVAGE